MPFGHTHGNHEEWCLPPGKVGQIPSSGVSGAMGHDSYGPGRTTNVIPREHWHSWNGYHSTTRQLAISSCTRTTPQSALPGPGFADSAGSTWPIFPAPIFSGKTAIVGHTPCKTAEFLDLGHLKCIDTFCAVGLTHGVGCRSGQICSHGRRRICNCQKTRCGRDLLSLGVVGTNLFSPCDSPLIGRDRCRSA